MTEIINGQLVYNELTKQANGGTELMARRMANTIDQSLLQGVQIIHSRVRQLDPDLKKILVCHDLATDPEVQQLKDPEYRAQFDKIVFVSNWQQQMYRLYLGIPFHESVVIPNAIETPQLPITKQNNDKIRLIYHTTPHRGLNILAAVMPEISKHFNVHLDVFSSFNAYGWGERDKHFAEVFERLEQMENVTNHGFQTNETVRQYLEQSHVFAYPSTWEETSCIALIEAMAFGNICVHSNYGALPETSGGLTQMYNFDENDNHHAHEFYTQMCEVLSYMTNHGDHYARTSHMISMVASGRYNWDMVKTKYWERLLMKVKQ